STRPERAAVDSPPDRPSAAGRGYRHALTAERATRVATEWPWHRPIFPGLGDPSIVGAEAFHYRVRHGNGWDHSALATRTNRSPREQLFQREQLSRQKSVRWCTSATQCGLWRWCTRGGPRVSENMDPADLMKRKTE